MEQRHSTWLDSFFFQVHLSQKFYVWILCLSEQMCNWTEKTMPVLMSRSPLS